MQTSHRLMIVFVLLTISLLTVTGLLAGDTLPLPASKAFDFRNTSFELPTATNLPYLWRGKNLANDRRVCNAHKKVVAYEGSCAFRFKADTDSSNLLRQKIDFTTGSNTVIEFSLWTKAKALTSPAIVIIKATYLNGSTNSTSALIPAGTYAYTPVTGSLALADTEGKLRISIFVPPGEGKLWVDDLTFQYIVDGATATPTPFPFTPTPCMWSTGCE